MGEMSDFYIGRMLDYGYGPRGRNKNKKPVCTHCGCKTVHWRLFGGAYRLSDDERQHPGNRYVPHLCETTADGLGDCDA